MKSQHLVARTTSTLSDTAGTKASTHALTCEEIGRRAFELVIERGGIYGCDLEDWLLAVREIQATHKDNDNGNETK